MTIAVALKLGRVSNLPTVWSNTIAGVVLAGGSASPVGVTVLALAMSLAYVGGMYLNDAMDHEFDARQRPERPIPSGQVRRGAVLIAGYSMLALSVATVAAHGALFTGEVRVEPLVCALALTTCIVIYDAWHKNNPLSPLLMASCRLGVYATAGYAVASTPDARLWLGGAGLCSYLVGLTYVAKQETLRRVSNLWPLAFLFAPMVAIAALGPSLDAWACLAVLMLWCLRAIRFLVPRDGEPKIGAAVVSLIAGIALWDATLALALGAPVLAAGCTAAFLATLAFQRWIPGT